MTAVDPAQGGWWMDPSDDGAEDRADASLGSPAQPWISARDPDEGWISAESLCEIMMLESMYIREELCCPRCGCAYHSYGPLQLCSRGCPENMRLGRASN